VIRVARWEGRQRRTQSLDPVPLECPRTAETVTEDQLALNVQQNTSSGLERLADEYTLEHDCHRFATEDPARIARPNNTLARWAHSARFGGTTMNTTFDYIAPALVSHGSVTASTHASAHGDSAEGGLFRAITANQTPASTPTNGESGSETE